MVQSRIARARISCALPTLSDLAGWPRRQSRARPARHVISRSRRLCPPYAESIYVSLIPPALLEIGQVGDRLVGGSLAVLGNDVDERALHILTHAHGAADVEVRTL